MSLMQALKVIGLPFSYILKPSQAGKEAPEISLMSALLYAFIVCLITYSAVAFFNSQDLLNKEQQQLLFFGSALFPVAISLIGVLLHFVFPAHENKFRIVRMVALPWNCISSAALLLFVLTFLQSAYVVTAGLTPLEAIDLSKSMKHVNAVIIFLISINIFWSGLSNIRQTSRLRNSGDVVVITAMLSIPYFFI